MPQEHEEVSLVAAQNPEQTCTDMGIAPLRYLMIAHVYKADADAQKM